MEMRHQVSTACDLLSSGFRTPSVLDKERADERNKVKAKHSVQHRSPACDGSQCSFTHTYMSPSSVCTTQQNVVDSRRSDPAYSVKKKNSDPLHLSSSRSYNLNSNLNSNSPKCNLSHHLRAFQNVQVVSIRESLENNVNKSGMYKGSPVTVLKQVIDRRYLSEGGAGTVDSGLGWGIGDETDSLWNCTPMHHFENEDQKLAPIQAMSFHMLKRPLPAVPAPDLVADHRASPELQNWTSIEAIDDHGIVLPSPTQNCWQPRMRDSPKESWLQRPQSEVILDSVCSVPSVDLPGVYIYGFKSLTHNDISRNSIPCSGNNILSNVNLSPKVKNNIMQQQFEHRDQLQQKYSPKGSNCGTDLSKGGNFALTVTDNMQKLNYGKSSLKPSHYQYKSPSHSVIKPAEESPATYKGSKLESLMGLDRSHIEDETLRRASWYQTGIPRDVALEILQQEDIGSFIVRDSTTHPGCYALSVRVPKFENPTGISHYLIIKTARGVKLKGLDKEWSTLLSLVIHHTVMPEMLPCTLRLPRDSKNPTFKDCDKNNRDDDPDYQRLADFSSMLATLKQ